MNITDTSVKTSLYIATSVDGFIARENGSIDWLPSYEVDEDYGYQEFMESVDGIVMGRNTFETVLSFHPWPYAKKPVIVLSSRHMELPEEIRETVKHMSLPPEEVVRYMVKHGCRHLYIDGGKTIQRFLNDGLISHLIITKIPILIGSGIPLFGPIAHDIRLKHILTRQYENGFVQSRYEVEK